MIFGRDTYNMSYTPTPLSESDLERIGLAMDKRHRKLESWMGLHASNLNPNNYRDVKGPYAGPTIQVTYPDTPRDIEMNERED
jgi:hypothetical protein